MDAFRENAAFRPAWSSYFVFHTAAVLFVLGPLVNPAYEPYAFPAFCIALLLVAFVVARRMTTLYTWKQDRIVVNNGIPAPMERDVLFSNIASVEVRQGLTQRALGIGNLALRLKEPPGEVVVLYGLRNPSAFRDRIRMRMEGAGPR